MDDKLNGCSVQREMPKYKCHKEVWALKIKEVQLDIEEARKENRETTGGAVIVPKDEGCAPFNVDAAYVRKHSPQPGGYYVVYEGGYKSFSPAEAFEKGYTKTKTAEECEVNIKFHVNKEQLGHIYKASEELAKAGVSFDTGGSPACGHTDMIDYDWEFDWSLKGATVFFKKLKD